MEENKLGLMLLLTQQILNGVKAEDSPKRRLDAIGKNAEYLQKLLIEEHHRGKKNETL